MNAFAAMWPKHLPALLSFLMLLAIGLSCGLKTDTEWRAELGGKKLSRASTSGAISDKINIYFCPNGDYAMQTQFSGFSTGGAGTLSVADEDVEFGRWTVAGATLILQSERGERHEYGIAEGVDSNVVELNGIGYLVTTHDECM